MQSAKDSTMTARKKRKAKRPYKAKHERRSPRTEWDMVQDKNRGTSKAAPRIAHIAARVGVQDFKDPALANLWMRVDGGRAPIAWSGWSDSTRPLVAAPNLEHADAAILRRNLARYMKWLGLTPGGLAKEAGLNESAVRQIFLGRSLNPRTKTMKAMAEVLLCDVDDLTGAAWFKGVDRDTARAMTIAVGHMFLDAEEWRERAKTAPDSETKAQYLSMAEGIDFVSTPPERGKDAPDPETRLPAHMAPAPNALPFMGGAASGNRDFPIYAAAQGGPEGALVMDWNPVEYIARPERFIGITDAWGVVIVDSSMSPEFEHGDTALVNPRLKPERGRTHVFVRRTETDETLMLIKRLEAVTDTEWKVMQYEPKQKFSLKRSEWQQCFRITERIVRK
jgi:transcriptional regulator with XRE-family HTH domain